MSHGKNTRDLAEMKRRLEITRQKAEKEVQRAKAMLPREDVERFLAGELDIDPLKLADDYLLACEQRDAYCSDLIYVLDEKANLEHQLRQSR